MFKALFFLALGIVIGGYAVSMHLQREAQDAGTPLPKQETLADKARAWRLSAEDIREDLKTKSEIVRQKAGNARETIANARVIAVIKAKYVLDRELSALEIGVSATDGSVTLTGKVASEELLGKAIALALDTDGVNDVTSQIAVVPPADSEN